jgi:hypothetical protein
MKQNSKRPAGTKVQQSDAVESSSVCPTCTKHLVVRGFYLSKRNLDKIKVLHIFCDLYIFHRDFDLAKRIAKNNPLNWKQAESLSNFCNQIVTTKESKPQDFISDEDTNSNKVIIKYLSLKHRIKQTKLFFGVKNTNELYKSVKKFYRKKMFCYQMDSYFTWLINGLFKYANDFISFDNFKEKYCFEISLFSGKTKPLNLKQAIRISQYILKC